MQHPPRSSVKMSWIRGAENAETSIPIGSMVLVYMLRNIWGILMVNVTIQHTWILWDIENSLLVEIEWTASGFMFYKVFSVSCYAGSASDLHRKFMKSCSPAAAHTTTCLEDRNIFDVHCA